MRYHALFVSGLACLGAACGGGSSTPDARIVDAAIDAHPDALLDAPAAPIGTRRYVIDKVMIPASNNQARMYGLDLNNDGTVDNQLGMVMSALAGMGLDVQAATDREVDRGVTITLGELIDTDASGATASFTLYDGADPMPAACAGAADPTCRHHLAGTATFSVAASSAHDTPLTGSTTASVYTAGPGHLHVQGAVPFGGTAELTLIGARVKLTGVTATAWGASVIAGAISKTEIDTKLIPAIQQGITAVIAHDCTMLSSPPQCGCGASSNGKTDLGLFDTNHDCAVSVDEVKSNSLIQSLLAPDVMIEGQMALSYGIGVTATHAAFTP